MDFCQGWPFVRTQNNTMMLITSTSSKLVKREPLDDCWVMFDFESPPNDDVIMSPTLNTSAPARRPELQDTLIIILISFSIYIDRQKRGGHTCPQHQCKRKVHSCCYAGPSAWNALPDLKKTVHFLYLLLDVSWNIFTSHSTSTPSAFEVFTANVILTFICLLTGAYSLG